MADAGLTQQRVADSLGILQSQLSRRLSGQVSFDLTELEQVAELCGVPTSQLTPDGVVL